MKTSAVRRNLVLLSVLYDTGARVQELCDLTTDDIYLQHPARMIITGKGGKSRQVPIIGDTRKILKQYIDEFHKSIRRGSPMPLFYNKYGTALSRSGVAYILKKYALTAELSFDYNSLTPHVLRHTKAMHMLQVGVKLIYIRDFLGHVDIKTTETYARADAEMKRKVFEKTVPYYTPNEPMPWDENEDLLSWLEKLGKPLK